MCPHIQTCVYHPSLRDVRATVAFRLLIGEDVRTCPAEVVALSLGFAELISFCYKVMCYRFYVNLTQIKVLLEEES